MTFVRFGGRWKPSPSSAAAVGVSDGVGAPEEDVLLISRFADPESSDRGSSLRVARESIVDGDWWTSLKPFAGIDDDDGPSCEKSTIPPPSGFFPLRPSQLRRML